MKKEKGFTLIELLAVIVILAILMVIAVPKILNVINNSRKSAAESSIKLLKDAIKTQVTSKDITNSNFEQDASGCYTFNFDDQKSGNANELNLKNKDKFTGSIKYCNGVFSDDTLKFDGNSIVSNNVNKKVICKRATTLHTEECTHFCSDVGYTVSGSKGTTTITYGNLGTKGTLASGDAFDCDVNGDETYDPVAERFYYVTDMNDTTAVLIYYNNVSKGKPSNSTTYAYDASGQNWHGPKTAIEELPSASEWKNVSLISSVRAITNENGTNTTTGGTLPSNFSYSGYAARLLTAQEINKACNITVRSSTTGELDTCNYLMENTIYSSSVLTYGYWIENARSNYSEFVWRVSGNRRYVCGDTVTNAVDYGVRPAIEVSKSNIDY